MALAQDIVDLADALGLDRFAIVGHGWGARAAYTVAALFSRRVTAIAALAVAYQPGGRLAVPDFGQAKAFWYQWLMCLDQGADAVRRDPVGHATRATTRWNAGSGKDPGRRLRAWRRRGPGIMAASGPAVHSGS